MANKKKAKPVKKVKAKVKVKAKPKPKPKVKAKKVSKPVAKTKTKKLAQKPVVAVKPALAKKIDYSKAITPLGDRLVVRLVSEEKITAGGLIIPDTVSEAVGFLKATVLAVGRGAQNKKGAIRPLDVKIGDSVLFSQHAGTKIKFNSEDLQIIQETDVMGIVQK